MMDNVPNEAKNKARDLLDQSEEELNNGNRDKAKQLHHSARHLSGIPEESGTKSLMFTWPKVEDRTERNLIDWLMNWQCREGMQKIRSPKCPNP